jgi:5-hydroxyisourate hydrolase
VSDHSQWFPITSNQFQSFAAFRKHLQTFAIIERECFMGLSTHVLDTMHGTPAAGMQVALWTTSTPDGQATLVKTLVLNADGRNPDGLLVADQSLTAGTYRLVFSVAAYFKARGVDLPEPPFLNLVSLDFGVANLTQHYHVPLLVSPWSYSTYRGS